MEKMMIIIYNSALEAVIMEYIDACEITCFTQVPQVFGRGETGGPRLGTHVWPGDNRMLWVVTDEEKIHSMLKRARHLKKMHQGKGVKVFVMPVEEKV
jgi:nitrogen regulatory protein PII